MRTAITLTAPNEVKLRYEDDFGEVRTDTYWIPYSGGYIREGANHSGDDRQVCVGLSSRGPTLMAKDSDDLLATIRREWRRSQRVCR